jgi:hypothetical protein
MFVIISSKKWKELLHRVDTLEKDTRMAYSASLDRDPDAAVRPIAGRWADKRLISINEIVEVLARKCGITVLPERRGPSIRG